MIIINKGTKQTTTKELAKKTLNFVDSTLYSNSKHTIHVYTYPTDTIIIKDHVCLWTTFNLDLYQAVLTKG